MDEKIESRYDFLKQTLTVDASHNEKSQEIGIGIVIQETGLSGKRGAIIEMLSETFLYAKVTPKDMELFAIVRAFEIAFERNYRYIQIRSDYNYVKKQVAATLRNRTSPTINNFYDQILKLAEPLKQIRMTYYPRRKNIMAHRLARKGAGIFPKAKNMPEPEYWLYEEISDLQ